MPTKKKSACLDLGQGEVVLTSSIPRGLERPRHHHYGLAVIALAVALIVDGRMSFRSAAKAMRVYGQSGLLAASGSLSPSASSIRLWTLRTGLGKVRRAKVRASDWIWLVDHSVQAGVHKCLVVLGIRLRDLPPGDWTLTYDMMEPLAIEPMAVSNGIEMHRVFQTVRELTGAPRGILADAGHDIRTGADAFIAAAGTETVYLGDSKHRVAIALKRVLVKDAGWLAFCAEANKFKHWVHQTPLAALAPPAQRTKARYHNIDTLVRWAENVMGPVFQNQRVAAEHLQVSTGYLQEKTAWFRRFRNMLPIWSELCAKASIYEQVLRSEGYHQQLPRILGPLLGPPCSHPAERMQSCMANAIAGTLSLLRPDERLPASTEVLESVIGTYKSMQAQHSKTGFTVGALSVGSVVADNHPATIGQALQVVKTASIGAWARTHIGPSIAALRRTLPRALLGDRNKNLASASVIMARS